MAVVVVIEVVVVMLVVVMVVMVPESTEVLGVKAKKWQRRVSGNKDPNDGDTDMKGDDFLPKPSLRAWPNSVASENSNVTLQCVSPTPGTQLVLRKGDTILDSRLPHHLTEGTAEFRLTNLQLRHAGYYTCEYYRKELPNKSSPSSDVLLLLVTGYLPKPSLRVQYFGQVATGGKVNLQCQKSHNFTEYKVFVLLKEGTSSPIQLLNSENDTVEFTLQNVTVHDAGRYSCVYLQAEAPFRASHPSEHLDISVAISLRYLPGCYTKIKLIRLGMSAMFVVIMAVFLAEAWYSQRVSPNRLRDESGSQCPRRLARNNL
ncbi:T-cell-interacting, activating receptor on myeloid cells protein 1-like [Arvicola amphibius]|uniref:T-cell-interacting, activating receptor on myeloid cells protein 1-like n=1 Tax=Arvicola amphibius TaxID=1047088 RepID=UPI001C09637A|nr:T-cell-interacting, activating receptor on myeloid cells protein 1-like [Arvicola amphibius]